jgi:hypothetical protein
MSASAATTYIFTARTCSTALVILEPCALNAEVLGLDRKTLQLQSR